MADNVAITAGAGTTMSTEEITSLNGVVVTAQQVQRVATSIRTADGAALDLPGDSANGLDVDVTRLPPLPAGGNTIGTVNVGTLPALATGANTIGTVNLGTLNGTALDTSVAKLNIAQGALLGTNTGPLIQGSVTTTAPAYTSGQISPLSLNAAGELRTTFTSAMVTNTSSGALYVRAGDAQAATSFINVRLTDGTAFYTASGGGGAGTQYTEDVAAAVDPIGTALNLIRTDVLSATTVSADGDNIAARGTSKGELHVKHTDSIPVTGTFFQATQPVSGTVTANAGTGVFDVTPATPAAADYLPVRLTDGTSFTTTGAGTQYTEGDIDATITGTALMWEDAADTMRVVSAAKPLPVDLQDTSVAVTGTFWQATQPVSGTVTANAGTGTMAVSGPLTDTQLRATAVPVSGTFFQATQPVSVAATLTTKEVRSATTAVTSVAAATANTSLLAANANRTGATVYNDSTAALYLKLGATASTTSFTVKMAADGYYEVPFDYTGAIDAVWASATGNARVTEVTA